MRTLVPVAFLLLFTTVSAQAPSNPRLGHWKLKSDAPAPQSNIMTYEPYNVRGMKITIDAVNAQGIKSQWWYTTMFDNKDEKLTGNPATDTGAVKILNNRADQCPFPGWYKNRHHLYANESGRKDNGRHIRDLRKNALG